MVRLIGSKVLRREAMGEGDIFLMAMVGAFIGWQATVLRSSWLRFWPQSPWQ